MKEQDGTAILRTRYLATECENSCFDRSTLGFIAHVLAEHDRSRDFFPPRHEDHPGFDSKHRVNRDSRSETVNNR
jgi:hypothetical protein